MARRATKSAAKTVENKAAKAVKAAAPVKAEAVKEEVKAAVVEEVKAEAVKEEVKAVEVKAEAVKEEVKAEAKAAAKPAAKKTAKKAETKAAPEQTVYLQYMGKEIVVKDVMAKSKALWVEAGNKEEDIKTIALYVKPEDNAAYYVINDDFTGSVEL